MSFRRHNVCCYDLLYHEARFDEGACGEEAKYLAYPREGRRLVLHGHLHLSHRIHLYAHLCSGKLSTRSTTITFIRSLTHSRGLQPFIQLIPAM